MNLDTGVAQAIVVVVCAVVWWIPTFRGLADLQRREHLPRPVVWLWTAVLAVPVAGAVAYQVSGRPRLDAIAAEHRRRPRRTQGARGRARRDKR